MHRSSVGLWYDDDGNRIAPPPAPPSQMDRLENVLLRMESLLAREVVSLDEIRDLLKAQQPSPPLPAVPYEQVAAAMDTPPYDPLAGLRKAAQEQQAARGDGPSFSSLQGMVSADDPRSSIDPRYPKMAQAIADGKVQLAADIESRRGEPRDTAFDGATAGAGYAETVRLPVSFPNALDAPQMVEYGLSGPLPPARPAGSEPSPLFAMLSAPLPGKAGPDSLYPDPTECPGWPNENVTQANIMQTIGVVGFTATIRPSAAEMGAMKAAYCKAHGIPDPTKGEWDHFVSLELGGHPRDPRNLWWERYSDGVTCLIGAREKDRVETALKRQIVSGAITLAEGQRLITTDWYASFLALNKMGMLPMLMTFDPSGDADEDDNG